MLLVSIVCCFLHNACLRCGQRLLGNLHGPMRVVHGDPHCGLVLIDTSFDVLVCFLPVNCLLCTFVLLPKSMSSNNVDKSSSDICSLMSSCLLFAIVAAIVAMSAWNKQAVTSPREQWRHYYLDMGLLDVLIVACILYWLYVYINRLSMLCFCCSI